MGSRVHVVAFLGAGLLPGLLGACYIYHPLLTQPEPTSHVALVLNDAGRVAAAPQIGPQAARVEGAVISATDTGYVLAVSGVKPIAGDWVKWTGETVSVRRDAVASLYERRLSRGRTVAIVAGLTFALVATASKLNLFGLGTDPADDNPGGGDPTDQ